tara:strand:+ start:693 stop:896 length:204 start_codon:yes stop_codon:yes gene_type:complete
MPDKLYEVKQKGKTAGFFKSKKLAKKYASQFEGTIDGQNYKIEVVEHIFLDDTLEEDDDGFNWGAWS